MNNIVAVFNWCGRKCVNTGKWLVGTSDSNGGNGRGSGCIWFVFISVIVLLGAIFANYYCGGYWHFTERHLQDVDLCSGGSVPGPVKGAGLDVDRTGLSDLAMESLGGSILSTQDTPPAPPKIQISIFGLPLVSKANPPPETIIRHTGGYPIPGNCWLFKGGQGSVIIQLAKEAKIIGFHLEHIDKKLDPEGDLANAPREFAVWGVHDFRCLKEGKRENLGNFTFVPQKCPLQYFPVQGKTAKAFSQIQFEIISNYGANVTCVYRFRVHGHTSENFGIQQL